MVGTARSNRSGADCQPPLFDLRDDGSLLLIERIYCLRLSLSMVIDDAFNIILNTGDGHRNESGDFGSIVYMSSAHCVKVSLRRRLSDTIENVKWRKYDLLGFWVSN